MQIHWNHTVVTASFQLFRLLHECGKILRGWLQNSFALQLFFYSLYKRIKKWKIHIRCDWMQTAFQLDFMYANECGANVWF